ncbi:hypothetical protein HDU96_007593 [Phlyctochytrium bullatum]|nr:hypothetical protein HDU96_007593 [Phlyctochytrium bullatum]
MPSTNNVTYKMYGAGASVATQRALLAFYEKDIPVELVYIDLKKGEHKLPEHVKHMPFGKVPYLENTETGFHLFESRAIARYIGTKFAGVGNEILGKDEEAKALTDMWTSIEYSYFNPEAAGLVTELFFKEYFGSGTPDLAKVKLHRENLERVLDVYEQQLSTRKYLTGDTVTIADLFHLPAGSLLFRAGAGDVFTKRPNVFAWWQRISARESWKKAAEYQW